MKFNNIKEVRKWKFNKEALVILSNTTTNVYEEEFSCLSKDGRRMLICLMTGKKRLFEIHWLEPYNKEAKEFFEKYK